MIKIRNSAEITPLVASCIKLGIDALKGANT